MIDEKLEIIIVSHEIREKFTKKLIDHLFIPLRSTLIVQTMETRKQEYFICSGCFHKLISFVDEYPQLVKILNLPEKITIHPMPSDASEKCERCTEKTADGYIPLAKPEQVVVN